MLSHDLVHSLSDVLGLNLFIYLFFPNGGKAGAFGACASENEIMEEGEKKGERRNPVAAAVVNKKQTSC